MPFFSVGGPQAMSVFTRTSETVNTKLRGRTETEAAAVVNYDESKAL